MNKENKTLSDVLLVLLNDYKKGNVSSIKFSMDATLVNEKLKELELKNEKLMAENENLKKIIAKELSENDEFGAEFVHVNILREKLKIAVDALNEIKAYGHSENCRIMKPYRDHYRCHFEEAEEAIKKLEDLK